MCLAHGRHDHRLRLQPRGDAEPGDGLQQHSSRQDDAPACGVAYHYRTKATLGGANDYDADMGADCRLIEELVLGIGVGYGHKRKTIADNGAESAGDSYGLRLYGSSTNLWRASSSTACWA